MDERNKALDEFEYMIKDAIEELSNEKVSLDEKIRTCVKIHNYYYSETQGNQKLLSDAYNSYCRVYLSSSLNTIESPSLESLGITYKREKKEDYVFLA
ncbi:MAG: hypothetical protein VXZ40_03720 [Nanoarchaeota archaeon]|nr:hypothetical protein [Nanoarchaeota archaeon]